MKSARTQQAHGDPAEPQRDRGRHRRVGEVVDDASGIVGLVDVGLGRLEGQLGHGVASSRYAARPAPRAPSRGRRPGQRSAGRGRTWVPSEADVAVLGRRAVVARSSVVQRRGHGVVVHGDHGVEVLTAGEVVPQPAGRPAAARRRPRRPTPRSPPTARPRRPSSVRGLPVDRDVDRGRARARSQAVLAAPRTASSWVEPADLDAGHVGAPRHLVAGDVVRRGIGDADSRTRPRAVSTTTQPPLRSGVGGGSLGRRLAVGHAGHPRRPRAGDPIRRRQGSTGRRRPGRPTSRRAISTRPRPSTGVAAGVRARRR